MAGVDHQGGNCGGEQPRTAGEQLHRQILHGSGVDEKAHGQRPAKPVAPGLEQDSEACAEHHIARQHGNGGSEGLLCDFFVHRMSSFC